MPEVTDENIDVLCHIGLNNMRQCHLTCKNGGKINGKKTAKPKCFCNRRSQDLPNGCFWMQNRQPVDTSSFTCSEPKKPFVPAPGSCEAKDKTCTTLPTSAIKWRFQIFVNNYVYHYVDIFILKSIIGKERFFLRIETIIVFKQLDLPKLLPNSGWLQNERFGDNQLEWSRLCRYWFPLQSCLDQLGSSNW